jgi:hypothetical protein
MGEFNAIKTLQQLKKKLDSFLLLTHLSSVDSMLAAYVNLYDQ